MKGMSLTYSGDFPQGFSYAEFSTRFSYRIGMVNESHRV